MNKAKLEKDGWRVGTVAEFLDLTIEEIEYIERKLKVDRRNRVNHQTKQTNSE